jgi:hypothetical protein
MLMRGTDDSVSLGEARHLVKQQRRVAHLALVDIDKGADLLFGLGAFDRLQLSGGFDPANPIP